MLYPGMMLPQILLDVAVSEQEVILRTGIFRFASKLLRLTREADPWTVVKLRPDWTKDFRLNRHHEFVCAIGRIGDVKRLNARNGCNLISTYLLNKHAVNLKAYIHKAYILWHR